MKKVQLLPNIVTAFGLSCGLFVIFRMSMTPIGGADEKVLTIVAGILLLAVIADLLDGAIARAMKAESRFGGLFDSLADAITFGVSPTVVVLKTLSIEPGSQLSFFLTLAAMVFSVSGVLRLVRFSMGIRQVVEGEKDLVSQSTFVGLPIPAAAAALVSLNLLLTSQNWIEITSMNQAWVLFSAMIILGYLMISRWKFPSLKTLHIRVASFQVLFLSTLGAVLFFYGILYHLPIVFFLIAWVYIVVCFIL
jgi:CDP-diacylglycerol--serine O-phosphatidyltransferase